MGVLQSSNPVVCSSHNENAHTLVPLGDGKGATAKQELFIQKLHRSQTLQYYLSPILCNTFSYIAFKESSSGFCDVLFEFNKEVRQSELVGKNKSTIM